MCNTLYNGPMRKFLIFILLISIYGCEPKSRVSENEWKIIEVGDYMFDFPSDFELITKNGIDSYVGIIKGDSMQFGFDYGYYSNSLGIPLSEFLLDSQWKYNLPYLFMKEGIKYDRTNMPKVNILEIRSATKKDSILGGGCDYVAICEHDNTKFDYAIYIPESIKNMNCCIDTIDNQYRKIVWAKKPHTGLTGIYFKDINNFNTSINNCLALSLATNDLSKAQQDIALKILKTGRRISKSEKK